MADGPERYRAARDLLLRSPPRLFEQPRGPLRREGESVVEAAVRLVKDLDHGVLPIQGPPGTGKTYTGARMIAALAQQGKRIGVTAVSHKVIDNLLKEVLSAAATEGTRLRAVHKDKLPKPGADPVEGLEMIEDNARAAAGLRSGKVVGGTTWFWSRDDMVESLDYLFVDEAGQMSLAHALATGRSAKQHRPAGRPPAAGAAAAGRSSRGCGGGGARSHPRRQEDDCRRGRSLPGRNLATASRHLPVHLRALLRGQAALARRAWSDRRWRAATVHSPAAGCSSSRSSTPGTRTALPRKWRRLPSSPGVFCGAA